MNFRRHAIPSAKTLIASVALALFLSPALARQDAQKQDPTKEDARQDPQSETPKKDSPGKDDPRKHYALIFGTIYDADDRPIYGVQVTIHPAGKKKPKWELISDRRGEFAQRVPPGPEDYEVAGRADMAPLENGKLQASKKKRFKVDAKVHIAAEERIDISLHLKE